MKNKQYRLAHLKRQLEDRKSKGYSYVIWNLNSEQIEFITPFVRKISPVVYEITTKPIIGIHGTQTGIIKDVHFSHRRGKGKIYRKMKAHELSALDMYGIKYRAIKFKILL